ncbi:hypothetical protein E0H22_07265 [Rhodopseudomonas boonkerdii]|nr:hypothetical protein E0H22_07265 [Rhodopseudomonas boonkerdii]
MTLSQRIAVAALVFTSAASAQPAWSQGTPQQRRACTPDVFRLCQSSIPDVDRITACLISHQRDLSEPCANVMAFRTSRSASTGAFAGSAEYPR